MAKFIDDSAKIKIHRAISPILSDVRRQISSVSNPPSTPDVVEYFAIQQFQKFLDKLPVENQSQYKVITRRDKFEALCKGNVI